MQEQHTNDYPRARRQYTSCPHTHIVRTLQVQYASLDQDKTDSGEHGSSDDCVARLVAPLDSMDCVRQRVEGANESELSKDEVCANISPSLNAIDDSQYSLSQSKWRIPLKVW